MQDIYNNNKAATSNKQAVYKDIDKIRISRNASENGNSKAVSKLKIDYPKLNESTIRPWVKMYKSELSSKKPQTSFLIGTKRERPTILSEELDQKLRAIIVNLSTAGTVINIHVVRGVLAGIVRSKLEQSGEFSDFELTKSWVRSLYHRMNFSRRAATTSRPITTGHDGKWLILNICKTLHQPFQPTIFLMSHKHHMYTKYVPATNVTMAEQGTADILVRGRDDKRTITVIIIQSLSLMLHFQNIFTGKTENAIGKKNLIFL